MKNIIYIGNYTLKDECSSAGAKRVLNQIKYLINHYNVLAITFSPYKSNHRFNLNLYTKYHKNIIDLLRYPLYWVVILWFLIIRRKKSNYLLLETSVELHTCVPILFAKILGYKIIHDIVENTSYFTTENTKQKISHYLGNLFEKNIKKYTSGIIVISERLKQKYQQMGLPMIKLYNSVERREYVTPVNDKYFTLFYSGSFGAKDGVLDLITAFEVVSKKYDHIRLHLVGKGDGSYYQECLQRINQNDKITNFGFLPEKDMFDLLAKSNLLCITRTNSKYANNGFPFKLAEYMSFGIPVLATAVSDIPILLRDKENIFLVEPENIDSICHTILEVMTQYDTALTIGERGKMYCEEYFSIKNIGIQLANFIDIVN